MSDLFCFLYNNFTKYTVYSYWISQLIIAIIRYIFVMYPIEVHNRMPDNESKNKLFKKILKWEVDSLLGKDLDFVVGVPSSSRYSQSS